MTKQFLFISLFLLSFFSYADNIKPSVILISIDGFAYDYLAKFQPKNILKLAEQGVSAKLLPVYPSKTFPNHLSIITGVYPAKHGIVQNNFYHRGLKAFYKKGAGKKNSAWLTALPLWSIAEQQNVKTAIYFWPESEAITNTSPPSYNFPYNKNTSSRARFDQLIDWLKLPDKQRPQLLISYFSLVDTAGHHFNINSPQLKKSIEKIDNLLGEFIKRLKQEILQDVDIILVSDHGMTAIDSKSPITKNSVLGAELERKISSEIDSEQAAIMVNGQTQLYFYLSEEMTTEDRSSILALLKKQQALQKNKYQIYSKETFPKHWHFEHSSLTVPDIIADANPPYIFENDKYKKDLTVGTHGFDAKDNKDLTALFIASGPSFHRNKTIPAFENIHIFPLISQLLGLDKTYVIDGEFSVLSPTLK
ncbi:MAG: alkaline phosphatase family protein [Colwellia sp.]